MNAITVPGFVKTGLKLIIGLGIIALLVVRFNPSDILNAIKDVSVPLLLAAVVVYAITLLFLSLRWRFILKNMGYSLPVLVTFQGFAAGILISDLTPARVGELLRPFTIQEMVPIPVGIGSVFLDRYCDFVAMFLLGCGGIVILSVGRSTAFSGATIILLSIPIIILSAFWLRRDLVLKFLHRLNIRRVTEFADHLGSALDSLNKPGQTMGSALSMTIFVWIFQSLRIVLIAAAVGYSIPLQELIFVQPLISALALIPVSLSGLGFVEGGYVTLFAQYSIPVASGLAIALLDRVLTVAFHFVAGFRYALRVTDRQTSADI